jgi:iron complex outermembrane receptor protein
LYYADTVVSDFVLLPPGTTLGPGNVFTGGLIGSPNKWERQLRLSAHATYSAFSHHSLRFGVGHDDLDLYRTTEYKNFNPNFSRIGTGSAADVTDFSDTLLKFMLPQRRKVDYVYVQEEWTFAKDWARRLQPDGQAALRPGVPRAIVHRAAQHQQPGGRRQS